MSVYFITADSEDSVEAAGPFPTTEHAKIWLHENWEPEESARLYCARLCEVGNKPDPKLVWTGVKL